MHTTSRTGNDVTYYRNAYESAPKKPEQSGVNQGTSRLHINGQPHDCYRYPARDQEARINRRQGYSPLRPASKQSLQDRHLRPAPKHQSYHENPQDHHQTHRKVRSPDHEQSKPDQPSPAYSDLTPRSNPPKHPRHNDAHGHHQDSRPGHRYKSLEAREASFLGHEHNFPHQTRAEMAEAGFYPDPQKSFPDAVLCFCCSIELHCWKPTDYPWVEHARHAPECHYLMKKKGTGFVNMVKDAHAKHANPRFAPGHNVTRVHHEDFSKPGHPYKRLEAREKSFRGHEEHFPHQTPADMADAGFYYDPQQSSQDGARCFSCDLGVINWEPTDTPWVEHARHAPKCTYLNTEMGPEFICSIQQSFDKEKKLKGSCAPYISNSQEFIVDFYKKESSPVYNQLLTMFDKREGMDRVHRAFAQWYFNDGSLGAEPPRSSNILNLLIDDKEASGQCGSLLLEQPVENLYPKNIRDQLEELENINENRVSIFQQAAEKRQISNDHKLASQLQNMHLRH